jgi:AcrR family transcriptional regulator
VIVADDGRDNRQRGRKTGARAPEVNDRREQILQTAQKLFAEQGFRESTLNDVAEQLGLTRQAVYHYFTSKDDLLYELMDRAGQAIIRATEQMFDKELAPDIALTGVVRSHVRQILSDIDIFRIQFAELDKLSGERADKMRAEQASYLRSIAKIITAGQKAGLFRKAHAMTQALLIIGMCNWTSEWFKARRSRPSIDEVADYAAQLAISGISIH